MKVTYKCVVCGSIVSKQRSPANIKIPPKFCSQKCSGLFKHSLKKGTTPNFTGICENCGKQFTTYRSPSNMSKLKPRFCSLKCIGESQKGNKNPAYNSGRYFDSSGYVVLFIPEHPFCGAKKTVLEHRFIMECKLGRYLKDEECVHHIDGNKANNNPNNLMLFNNNSEHMKYHNNLKNKNNG
jgi:DNA-directed RNA polymerase subunit RPC12/RpoP